MGLYKPTDNQKELSSMITQLIERADRQIRINEAEINAMQTLVNDIISNHEQMTDVLDQNDRTEGILRYLLLYQCRQDLISRCSEMILNGRFSAVDLIRIFPGSVYSEAADLLKKAYIVRKNTEGSFSFSCPDPDGSVYVQDPEVHRQFSEYEQVMNDLDRKAETQQVQRYLVSDRYRSELICLAVKYILAEELSVNDLKSMFGPDICAEAFMLYQRLQAQWFTETSSRIAK